MSLRTLGVKAQYLSATRLLTYALSTILSPVFSEVTVFYRDLDFQGAQSPRLSERPIRHPLSPDESAEGALYHEQRLNVFRTMHEVRNFQLLLYADVWSGVRG
jgi:hypothetical protein